METLPDFHLYKNMKKKFPEKTIETILTAVKTGVMTTTDGIKSIREVFSLCFDEDDVTDVTLDNDNKNN